jgi:uncharacterized protein (TIGR03437 family)
MMRVKPYVSAQAAGLLAAAVLVLFPLPNQAQTIVIGAGYTTPQPIDASPGQVITIFARVTGKQLSQPVMATSPLPSSLGGFAVLLRQSFIDPIQIPIISVTDTQSCSTVSPSQCDTVSQVTVQIPFELMPNVPHLSLPQNFARLEISYNDSPTSSLFLNPVPDSMHVLNSCDAASGVIQPNGCAPLITHADGSFVTADNPAQPGETLTISLVGMGLPPGPVATGIAVPQTVPTLDGVLISYDARVNASPSLLVPTSAFPLDGAQLRPGSVGIYDVPVLVPSLPPGVAACGSTVKSNLTVNISRTTSFAGVGICVTPNAQ